MLECRHALRPIGDISVVACADCASVRFWDADGPLDTAEGVARVFGSFAMRTSLPALGAPGRTAMVYDAPDAAGLRALAALPTGAWLAAQPGLWLGTDGTHLLLSPSDPTIDQHLGRGA